MVYIKVFKEFLLALLVFSMLYQISFSSIPSVSSQRAFFFILIFCYICCAKFFKLTCDMLLYALFALIASLAIYSALSSLLLSLDFVQFSRFFHFMILCFIAPYVFVKLFKNESSFHTAVIYATLIQIVFVFLTYSFSEFNEFVSSLLYTGDDRIGAERATGLSSEGGATLSVAISLGALSLIAVTNNSMRVLHLVILLLIIFSCFLVGRTGMLVSILSLGYLLVIGKVNFKTIFFSVFIFLPLVLLVIYFLSQNEQFLSYTLRWAISIFTGEDKTLSVLLSQQLSALDDFTVIFGGAGVIAFDGLNSSGSDVGYIQTFYAIGLPLSFLFYFSIFLFYVSFSVEKRRIGFKILLIVLVFILELKEPFIFKYALPFYVLVSLLYMSNSHRARIRKINSSNLQEVAS